MARREPRHHAPAHAHDVKRAHMAVLAAWLCADAVAFATLLCGEAVAHDGDHRVMRHMVTAGITPLSLARIEGGHARAPQPIAELVTRAVGVSAGYSFAPVRELELRARLHYLKPFPIHPAYRDGLHAFRATVGPVLVRELIPYRLEGITALELGLAVYRLENGSGTSFDTAHAAGMTASALVGVRGWVTWHTGFWGEVRAGAADTGIRDQLRIWSAWPLELSLGWADRF